MAYYGPGPYYGGSCGPAPGPCGPYGPVPGPCGPCGPFPGPCGPCGPLVSGVGKCLPPPVPCGPSWEIDLLPTTGTSSNVATGFQPIYTNNLRAATTITSIVDGAYPVVTYNLQNVKGSVCNVSATLAVTKIQGTGLVTQVAVASQAVQPFSTSATLTFNTSPAGATIAVGPLAFTLSELSTKFT